MTSDVTGGIPGMGVPMDLAGKRVVFVHAHPDDEAITTGGTISRLVRRGAQVTVVTCTLGELGEVIGDAYQGLVADGADQLGGFRVHELGAALAALGCNGPDHAPVHLGGAGRWRDSGMVGDPGNDDVRAFIRSGAAAEEPVGGADAAAGDPAAGTEPAAGGTDEALAQLTALLAELRPHVVVTYDADGGYGHPDHIHAHELTVAACADLRESTGEDLWATMWTVTDDAALAAGLDAITVVPDTWTRAGFEDLPSVRSDFAVDLDARDIAAKAAALRAHATQVWVGDGSVGTVNPAAAIGAVDESGAAAGVWALSNLVCQPLIPAEHYRLGTATRAHAEWFAGPRGR